MFIIVVFSLGNDRPSGLLFFRARFTSFYTHASLLTAFVCFVVLFHSCCSHARVFVEILVHEFYISYSHTEWYLFFAKRHDWNGRRVVPCPKLFIIIKLFLIKGAKCIGIINFVPSVKIKEEMHFKQTPAKSIYFLSKSFYLHFTGKA